MTDRVRGHTYGSRACLRRETCWLAAHAPAVSEGPESSEDFMLNGWRPAWIGIEFAKSGGGVGPGVVDVGVVHRDLIECVEGDGEQRVKEEKSCCKRRALGSEETTIQLSVG